MSKAEEIRLGLRKSGSGGEEARAYERSSAFWYDLVGVMAEVVEKGGLVSVYTSRDRNATAITVKAGKDHKTYWLGPDDHHRDVFQKIVDEWGLEWLLDPLFAEVERAASQMHSNGLDGS